MNTNNAGTAASYSVISEAELKITLKLFFFPLKRITH